MIAFALCLGGCDLPWQKQTAETTEKPQTIESSEVKGSMKGMKLKVGVSNEMAPFSFYDEDKKELRGFDIDILKSISDYLGFEYETQAMPIREIEKRLRIRNWILRLPVFQLQMPDRKNLILRIPIMTIRFPWRLIKIPELRIVKIFRARS